MNGIATFGDEYWRSAGTFCDAQSSALPQFRVSCGRRYSLVCYLLMTRLQNRRANRSAPRDGFLPDGGNYTAAEGWIISSRFGSANPHSTARAMRAIQREAIAEAAPMGRRRWR